MAEPAAAELPRTLAVVGAGTMGAGIAQVALQAGLKVMLYDVAPAGLDRARERIRAGLEKARARGKLQGNPEAALGRLQTTTALPDVAAAEFVIEAAPEDLDLKRRLFAELDRICPPGTVLATNTSSLPVTAIAAAVQRPERVVGMHFFNPVPAMKLVEVVSAHATAPWAVDRTVALARALGKHPARAGDTPGFIVNRVARPFYGEALRLVNDGIATPEQVDQAARAAGFRMGPFALMDLIGIDINLAVSESVHRQFYGEPRFRPLTLQARMVQSGRIGRKVGAGFYRYGEDGRAEPADAPGTGDARHARSQPAGAPGTGDARHARSQRADAPGTGDARHARSQPAGTPATGTGRPVLVLVEDPGSRDGEAFVAAAGQAGVAVHRLTPPELPPAAPGGPALPAGTAAVIDLSRSGSPAVRQDRVAALEQALPAGRPLLVAHPGGPITPLAAGARHPERVLALGGLPPYGAAGVVEVGLPLQAGLGERLGWGPISSPQRGPASGPTPDPTPDYRTPNPTSAATPGPVRSAENGGTGSGSALAAMAALQDLLQRLGLEPLCLADSPGLIAARILSGLVNEAMYAVMEGVATPADIDRAMELGTGYPRGPLAWGQEVGLPFILETLTALHADTGEERYRPAPLLRRLVQAGRGTEGRAETHA